MKCEICKEADAEFRVISTHDYEGTHIFEGNFVAVCETCLDDMEGVEDE